MSFDFEHLKKLCVCSRFKTKGLDYGEIHPVLGKCGVGQRWAPPSEQIELTQKKYIELEKTIETQKSVIAHQDQRIRELEANLKKAADVHCIYFRDHDFLKDVRKRYFGEKEED